MSQVSLAVYDLSQGMAAQLSVGFLGKQIDGIWHTGIVVFGREYYFGGGLCSDYPGTTPYGTPVRVETLGTTTRSQNEFMQFLRSVSSRFTLLTYDLFENNCNNFSDACAMFLTGQHIPRYILDLPNEALNSPMGPALRGLLSSAQGAIRDQSAGHELDLGSESAVTANANTSVSPAAAPASGKERTAYIWRTARTLARSNRTAVVAKLREIAPAMKGDEDASALLTHVLTQKPEEAFPALDLLRLAALKDEQQCLAVADGLMALSERFCSTESVRPAHMMTVRCWVNCFAYAKGEQSVMDVASRGTAVQTASDALRHAHKAVRLAGAMLTLNLAGAHSRRASAVKALEFEDAAMLASALCELITPDSEALAAELARAVLEALAVLIDKDDEALQLVQVMGASAERYTRQEWDADTRKAAALIEEKRKQAR